MHRSAFTYRLAALKGIAFAILGVLALAAGGCAGTVDPAKLAAQPRGEPLAQVERRLGDRGTDVFEIRSDGAVYYCRSCQVGDSADLYYIIFRDGALWKVVRDPGFTHYPVWRRPLASPEYLWGRATELLDAPDVAAPPNRPKSPEAVRRDQENAQMAVGWLLAMSPFIIGFSPVWLIAGGICAVSAHPIHMADVHLGDTAAALESRLGPATAVWPDPAGGRQWRRYQGQNDGTSIVTVLLRDGVVIGRFSAWLLDDCSPTTPAASPAALQNIEPVETPRPSRPGSFAWRSSAFQAAALAGLGEGRRDGHRLGRRLRGTGRGLFGQRFGDDRVNGRRLGASSRPGVRHAAHWGVTPVRVRRRRWAARAHRRC